ncbi:GNAT family N-acetyltransferase [Stappia sp.]|uniref:GNAT family N-acetyltransferase n=1 Tax=Stappia sp. TaxID=1870903 RepID=UPI003A99FE5E
MRGRDQAAASWREANGRQVTTGSSMIATVFATGEAGPHLGAWRALAGVTLEPNPFFGPEFLIPYLQHMEPEDVAIVAIRDAVDGAFLALAPFACRRAGLLARRVTMLAGDYGPLGAPLVAPDADPQVPAALLDAAAGHFGGRLAVLPYLRTDGPVFELLQDMGAETDWRLTRDNDSLRAGHATGATGREQYRMLGTRRRKELDRQFRRLGDAGTAELTSVTDPAGVAEAFERFLELEAAGWKGRRGTALASEPSRAAFARAFVRDMARVGKARIDVLTQGGTAVAMLVMLRDRDRVFSWKIAFDEACARLSPGAQVTRYAMRRNLEEAGVAEADSLAVPDHPMITPLWRGKVPYATLLVARGRAAGVALAFARADLAARRGLRRIAKAVLRRLRPSADAS